MTLRKLIEELEELLYELKLMETIANKAIADEGEKIISQMKQRSESQKEGTNA